jgi:GWxTD domain-containing protein
MNSVVKPRRTWDWLKIGIAFGLVFIKGPLPAVDKPAEPWAAWLDEVHLIMTRAESSVFRSLTTEEDRRRFQKLFWEIRDPNPKTAQNEFMQEYYARRAYARQHFRGPDSDRGRIYLILGPPAEKRNFGGYEDLIDCEVWAYRTGGSGGLPPFLNFIFFKPGNLGDYKLYTPGLHSPLDLLAYQGQSGGSSKRQAYASLRRRFPDLAEASLSVTPEAGGANLLESTTSSGHILAQVFSLPEREVSTSYLRNFSAANGTVDVSSSTSEILGWSAIAVGEARGLRFLSYSLMPDILHTVFKEGRGHTASLSTILRVEDGEGRTIHQQERDFEFLLDTDTMARAEKAKIVFQDFAPILDGEFTIILSFRNRTTDEFFTSKEILKVAGGASIVLAGFKIRDMPGEGFGPFRIGTREVLADPRGLFSREDTLEGVVSGSERPDIQLVAVNAENPAILVREISSVEGAFVFRHPLQGLKPGDYRLIVRVGGSEIYRRAIKVLSFGLEKPVEADRAEDGEAFFSYLFEIGRQHLNRAEPDTALSFFSRIPPERLTPPMRPAVARAFYDLKNHEKVIQLLEAGVPKDYPVLWLLGNSYLELRKFREAAEAFEKLRAYGDTPEKNRTLGALYFSLGDRDKAREYWNRADRLEKEREGKKPPERP